METAENRTGGAKQCETAEVQETLPAAADAVRRQAVVALLQDLSEEHLWACVVAFQEMPLETMSGLPYSYKLKTGRNGSLTRELWVDRREHSKSITWSSVRMAFESVLNMKESLPDGTKPYVKRPKALGDIRGISYIYPLFSVFGLIETEPGRGERTGQKG